MRYLLALVLFLPALAAQEDPPEAMTAVGELVDGKRDGLWKFVDAQKTTRYEIDYHRGKRSGAYKRWNEEGRLVALGEFFDDRRHGVWDEFHDTGERSSTGEYFAGVRHGFWKSFHSNGKLSEEGQFELGKRKGNWRGYHTDDSTSYSGAFEDDAKHGQWTTFFLGGASQETGTFVHGVRDGRWQEWDESGTLLADLVYTNGVVTALSAQAGVPSNSKLKEYHVIAAREGSRMRGQVEMRDGEVLGRVNVRLTRTGIPQVLLLSARDPVEWELDVAPGVVIDRIILAGKHRQSVKDAPPGVLVEGKFEVDGDTDALFVEDQRGKRDPAALEAKFTKALGASPTSLTWYDGVSRVMIGRVAERAVVPPEDAELHCVGVYEGTGPGERKVGEKVTGAVTVKVERKGVPLVLALCAYESVRWKLQMEPGVVVHSIILSGYYDQFVEGAPESASVRNLKAEGRKQSFYCYSKEGPEFRRAEMILRDMTGIDLTGFQGSYRGSEFTIAAGEPVLDPPPIDARMYVFCATRGVPVPGKPDEKVINLKVRNTESEIVLVLGCDEDVTWNIEAAKNVVIERVILIGKGAGRVRGRPGGCPLVRRTKPAKGDNFVETVSAVDAPEVAGLKFILKDLTGLAVTDLVVAGEVDELALD